MAVSKVRAAFYRRIHGVAEYVVIRAVVGWRGRRNGAAARAACHIWLCMLTAGHQVLVGVRIFNIVCLRVQCEDALFDVSSPLCT